MRSYLALVFCFPLMRSAGKQEKLAINHTIHTATSSIDIVTKIRSENK